jgi:hypothetical protein
MRVLGDVEVVVQRQKAVVPGLPIDGHGNGDKRNAKQGYGDGMSIFSETPCHDSGREIRGFYGVGRTTQELPQIGFRTVSRAENICLFAVNK